MRMARWLRLGSLVLVLTSGPGAVAQVVESSFADGQSAFVASRQPGLTFALNPAVLGAPAPGRRHRLLLDAAVSHYPKLSSVDFPDFELTYHPSPRLAVGLRKSALMPGPAAGFTRVAGSLAQTPLPFRVAEFSYRQDWSVGAGVALNEFWHGGVALRREVYATFPTEFTYWTADLGVQWQRYDWLRAGAILRNLAWKRLESGRRNFAYQDAVGTLHLATWDPAAFGAAATRPHRSLEAGIWLRPLSHWQFLLDASSRGEYAWGIRWRVAGPVYVVGGEFHRYDRIFDSGKITGNSLGLQIQLARFGLGFSAVFPTRRAPEVIQQTPYGRFEVIQGSLKAALLGMYFSF